MHRSLKGRTLTHVLPLCGAKNSLPLRVMQPWSGGSGQAGFQPPLVLARTSVSYCYQKLGNRPHQDSTVYDSNPTFL